MGVSVPFHLLSTYTPTLIIILISSFHSCFSVILDQYILELQLLSACSFARHELPEPSELSFPAWGAAWRAHKVYEKSQLARREQTDRTIEESATIFPIERQQLLPTNIRCKD